MPRTPGPESRLHKSDGSEVCCFVESCIWGGTPGQDGSSDLGLPSLVSLNAKCVVILDNLRSAFNVGSVFRTSECLLGQVASLVLTGYTVRAPVLPLP